MLLKTVSTSLRPIHPTKIINVVGNIRKMSAVVTYKEYDPKGMPFRRLGPSGLRVPLFSLGGCQ